MKRVHYSWVICFACSLLIFVTMGTASNSLSAFTPYIMEDYGLTNAQTSFLVTLRCAFALAAMFVVGIYYKLIGYRLGTGIAAILGGCSYLIYYFANGYLGICIGAVVAGISYGLGTMIPVSILINNWFIRHKALAVGICSAGSGVAVIILPPIVTRIILNTSLDNAFLVTAFGLFAAALLILLLIRTDPAEMGLKPLGYEDSINASQNQDAKPEREEGIPKIRHTREFTRTSRILILIVCAIMGAMANPGFMHLSVLYTSEGYPAMMVAALISITGFVLTAGKIVYGEVTDRLGGYITTIIFFSIYTLANITCSLAGLGSNLLAVLGVTLYGIGSSSCTVGIPVWAGDLDRSDRFASNVRHMQITYAAGAMIFASAPGIIADHFGSYTPYYGVFALLTIFATVCIVIAYTRPSLTDKRLTDN